MIVKKNEIVIVDHVRKGIFKAFALRDFDTDKEEFYPLAVYDGTVKGISGGFAGMIGLTATPQEWNHGEEIPCRNTLCKIAKVEA